MNNIPTVTRKLLIVNLIMFVASMIVPSLSNTFGLHYWQASQFSIFQLLSYMFMHAGFTHIFFNMFALWMFGGVMERTWGANRFLAYYLVCGVGAGIVQEISQFVNIYIDLASQGATLVQVLNIQSIVPNAPQLFNGMTTVGASGCVYGILLAFGMTYPEERMIIFPLPVPIKAKWFVMGYVVIELVLALSNPGDGVAHVAHLGGMLFGYVLIRYWRSSVRRQSDFSGWDSYVDVTNQRNPNESKAATILGKIRKALHLDRNDDELNNLNSKRSNNHKANKTFSSTSTHSADWDYNAQQKATDEEIDAILDKIRRSGYAALSADEKRKLFEASKK